MQWAVFLAEKRFRFSAKKKSRYTYPVYRLEVARGGATFFSGGIFDFELTDRKNYGIIIFAHAAAFPGTAGQFWLHRANQYFHLLV